MVERANKRQTRVRSIDVPKSKRLDDRRSRSCRLREGIFATFCRDLETPAEIGRDSFEIGHPSYPPPPPSFLALGLLLRRVLRRIRRRYSSSCCPTSGNSDNHRVEISNVFQISRREAFERSFVSLIGSPFTADRAPIKSSTYLFL